MTRWYNIWSTTPAWAKFQIELDNPGWTVTDIRPTTPNGPTIGLPDETRVCFRVTVEKREHDERGARALSSV